MMKLIGWMPVALFGALLLSSNTGSKTPVPAPQPPANQTEWPAYGGGPDAIRYSSLTQKIRERYEKGC